MKTIVYISRHAESLSYNSVNKDADILVQNMVKPLSLEGEKGAYSLSKLDELHDIDVVYSSNYSRAIATAKYIAMDKMINTDYRLSERVHGIRKEYSELPEGFEKKQIEDESFKYGNGESRSEVANRMYDVLLEIVRNNMGKKIYITSHCAAITFLLMKVCRITKSDNETSLYYNNTKLIDNSFNWNSKIPRMFKFIFDDDKLVDIFLVN